MMSALRSELGTDRRPAPGRKRTSALQGVLGTDSRSAGGRTLAQVLFEQAKRRRDQPFMRAKRHGIWRKTSWTEFAIEVRQTARALMRYGIARGDVVAIISENLPEVYRVEYAAHCVGATVTCLYPDASAVELSYILAHSGARMIFAEDQEQVDKILSLPHDEHAVVRIVYLDPRGLWGYEDARLLRFADMLATGEPDAAAAEPDLDAEIAKGEPDDLAALCYTSGTTGKPKGVVLTHRYLLDNAYRLVASFEIPENVEYLSYISPAWAAEQITGLALGVLAPAVVNFAEKPETIQSDLRELGPQFLLFTPRQWEMLASGMDARMLDAGTLRRHLVMWALEVARPTAGGRAAGANARLAEWLVLRALRDNLGLKRALVVLSAGSGLSAEVFTRFHALGVPLRNLYGSTEIGLFSAHWGGSFDPATMGRPLQVDPSVGKPLEATVSADGELLVRGGSGFRGYFRDEEATARVLDEQGFYRTGDAIRVTPDGELLFLDRVKDLRRLATGKAFPPQFIENQLRASPFIRDVIALGDERRDVVTALVNIDAQIVGKYAESKNLAWSTFADLSQLEEVHGLVRQALAQVNIRLDPHSRVRRFATFPKELDPDDAELTRSRKLRRDVIEQRYGQLIEAMYAGASGCPLEVTVQYQDGTQALVNALVRISDA